ncbi:hypothetical protein [Kribbella sp. NPDC050459]|uniref:hypothetical protein n=1 Tax=Kribbella sp. NPDC050459 TaxID=3155785 RepID=UPI0033D31A16
MSGRDPRVGLSGELLPEHALSAVQALDHVRVVVMSGDSPAAALTAAALLVLVARTHAHVEVLDDISLPRNPWDAGTLTELLTSLGPLRPTAQATPERTIRISTGRHPDADRYITPSAWTVAVTDKPLAVGVDRAAGGSVDGTVPVWGDPAEGLQMKVAPYGGMFAAAIVVADLFCAALAPLGLPTAPRRSTFLWNLLDYTYTTAQPNDPTNPLWPRLLFAGCGSVGSSAAAALACDNLSGLTAIAVDADSFDPARNMFRYPAATGIPGITEATEVIEVSGVGATGRGRGAGAVGDGVSLGGVVAKAAWIGSMLGRAGAAADHLVGPVRSWTTSQAEPGFDGVVVSSLDDIDGRYEVADMLARATMSVAVRALSFHLQREHLGDGMRCPFCDFVTTASPLAQAAADAQLTGLSEQRVVQLLHQDSGLEQHDVDLMVSAGKLTIGTAQGLVGGRLADLRNRIYAQAAIPAAVAGTAPPAPLSAPFVSWAAGVLIAAEVAKLAYGLAPVERRVEVDLHGYPADFVHVRAADTSGRCACSRAVRVRWMQALYSDDASVGQPADLHWHAAPGPGRARRSRAASAEI